MEAFDPQFVGRAVALHFDHLDRNDIIPRIQSQRTTKKEAGQYFLNNHRYLPGLPRKEDPDFIINTPEGKAATILIPGAYFATEAEFEQQVWTVLGEGFRVIISNEIGKAYQRHMINNGMLPIQLSLEALRVIEDAGLDEDIKIDLDQQSVQFRDHTFYFAIDPDDKERLINGLDDIDLTMEYSGLLENYEARWNSFYGTNDGTLK